MSFGFGLGDFVTLSALTVSLYRSFKNAPGEFHEVSRQLQSLHIVIADLTDQAKDQASPLHQNGATRGYGIVRDSRQPAGNDEGARGFAQTVSEDGSHRLVEI